MIIEPGVLYVVATPIGNLGDIGARALRVLRDVDCVAAEDTRHSKQLLRHFGIDTPLLSLHEHNEQSRIPQLLEGLRAGKSIALVADAGTPLISDPGFQLLRAVQREGLRAVPIPGPSSLLAALSVAGLPTDRFVFEGFPPSKPAARHAHLRTLASEQRTLVFFESSHRIQASLDDMRDVFGASREAALARELTKQFEEVRAASLGDLCQWLASDVNRQRGEFVLVVHGAPPPEESTNPLLERLLTVLLDELPISQAVGLTVKMTGEPKNAVYRMALAIKKPS